MLGKAGYIYPCWDQGVSWLIFLYCEAGDVGSLGKICGRCISKDCIVYGRELIHDVFRAIQLCMLSPYRFGEGRWRFWLVFYKENKYRISCLINLIWLLEMNRYVCQFNWRDFITNFYAWGNKSDFSITPVHKTGNKLTTIP